MMDPIIYIDRITGKTETERVYGAKALELLYGNSMISKCFGKPILHALVKNPIFSAVYGYLQKLPSSKRKIVPFIKEFQVDSSEFLEPVDSFKSFNDFFIRKLKPAARPIPSGKNKLIIPADGRYRVYQDIEKSDGFIVKGEKFDLKSLLEDEKLASKYTHGSMVMARLCPSDYHRYHFPCDCLPSETRFINGWLYSVNPIALKQDIHIFTQNKRTICDLETDFGKVLFLEIGATNVGSIHQTYTANQKQAKGAEKGYFSFGASSLLLLFEPGVITFDKDLIDATNEGFEIKCLMGQSLGKY
jgi:phosphatidylserine decarboxylase